VDIEPEAGGDDREWNDVLGGGGGQDWDQLLTEVLADDRESKDRPPPNLDGVGGMGELKQRLKSSFLGPLQHPNLRKIYHKPLRGGLLLWGPPGCGKTYLAQAVAGELGARFLDVGLHDLMEIWLGQSEHSMHEVFENARRRAPCLIFLDEVDALGHKRSNLAGTAARNVVVQLLAELDGLAAADDGVFLLAATNQPWDVDPALRRPGRLDRSFCVLPPDQPAREAILAHYLRDRPLGPVDLGDLATRTDGYSGADLRLVCDIAAERVMECSVVRGEIRPICARDLEAALAETRPSTRAWFEMARNYVRFANADGEYDEVRSYLRKHRV
jgi:SpoVK/Ycf46/Vps4 family AAA+-type ATPase